MFEKLLSSIGVGKAKVDTVVSSLKVKPGNDIKGKIIITGGKVKQKITSIRLSLSFTYENNSDDTEFRDIEYLVCEKTVKDIELVEPNKTQEVPFVLSLPNELPVTTKNVSFLLKTTVEIPYAPDPMDRDEIIVYNPFIDEIQNEFKALGFYETDNSGKAYARPHEINECPYEQVFEWYSHYDEWNIDKLKCLFLIEKEQLTLLLEIERDDIKKDIQCTFNPQHVQIKETIRDLINSYQN